MKMPFLKRTESDNSESEESTTSSGAIAASSAVKVELHHAVLPKISFLITFSSLS